MNLEPANKWLTLLANMAVLAGIVFLALEVRQSNHIAIAATEMSVWDKYVSLNRMALENDGVAALLVKAADRDAEFSPEEKEKMWAYLYCFFNTWYSVETAYDNGMTTDITFDIVRNDIESLLGFYPAFRLFMQQALDEYPAVANTQILTEMRRAVENSVP